ncbi:MAG: hypothetical protein EBZ48_05720 [Proteobacteria bacterium]|nr:hypothetical protein [Pseudomonadota bacterium]
MLQQIGTTDGLCRDGGVVKATCPLALPRDPTALVVLGKGVVMEPLSINATWTESRLHGPCAAIKLPSPEEAHASLWMAQPVMDGAREYLSYECHDLRIVKVDKDGRLSLLVCKRAEPAQPADGSETAPLNGFWWAIGGRREIPRTDSPLDGRFDLKDSVLHKARRETGIEPQNVLGIFDLGIGRTEFPARMYYVSKWADAEGQPRESIREVTLSHPQRTINRNFVLLVDTDATIGDQSVERLSFLSQEQWSDPRTRSQFCEYEQAFIDAIFNGWTAYKLEGRKLDGV